MCDCWFVFFFVKQKTAYEMRISDWSSDVCSSDLRLPCRPSLDAGSDHENHRGRCRNRRRRVGATGVAASRRGPSLRGSRSRPLARTLRDDDLGTLEFAYFQSLAVPTLRHSGGGAPAPGSGTHPQLRDFRTPTTAPPADR